MLLITYCTQISYVVIQYLYSVFMYGIFYDTYIKDYVIIHLRIIKLVWKNVWSIISSKQIWDFWMIKILNDIFKIIFSCEILIFRGTVFLWILGIFTEIIVRDLWICHVFDFLSIYDCNNVWWTMYEQCTYDCKQCVWSMIYECVCEFEFLENWNGLWDNCCRIIIWMNEESFFYAHTFLLLANFIYILKRYFLLAHYDIHKR